MRMARIQLNISVDVDTSEKIDLYRAKLLLTKSGDLSRSEVGNLAIVEFLKDKLDGVEVRYLSGASGQFVVHTENQEEQCQDSKQ